MRLRGRQAIKFAKRHDLLLSKYEDPEEGPRWDLTVNEANDVARADPSLIYIDVDAVTRKRLRARDPNRSPPRTRRHPARRHPARRRRTSRDESGKPVDTRTIANAIAVAKDELRVMQIAIDKYTADPRYYAPQLQHLANGAARIATVMRVVSRKLGDERDPDHRRRRRR